MKILGIGVLIIAAIVALVLIIGWSLPVSHHVTRSASLRASPDSIFALISRPADFPQWRSDVTRVESAPPEGAARDSARSERTAPFCIRSKAIVPNQRLVTRIADQSLPFGGAWTYEIIPSGESTTLRITEDGEVYNPLFRFVSRFIMGHTATLDRYLTDDVRSWDGASHERTMLDEDRR